MIFTWPGGGVPIFRFKLILYTALDAIASTANAYVVTVGLQAAAASSASSFSVHCGAGRKILSDRVIRMSPMVASADDRIC